LIWERLKLITEPSSAVALAPLLKSETLRSIATNSALARKPRIGIILSGGNVDLGALPFR
jgi:threonine dehydratase